MGNLKLSVEEIKQLISLREEYWEYDFQTNCYAFALGLDIPEYEIIKNAYQLGVIGAAERDIPIGELKKMAFEDRLFLDLDALNILHEEINPLEKTIFKFNYDKNKCIISTDFYWLIALFSSGEDFHFLRKAYDGIWWHKRGFLGHPSNHDSNGVLITDPEQCNISGYKYAKTYKLKCRVNERALF